MQRADIAYVNHSVSVMKQYNVGFNPRYTVFSFCEIAVKSENGRRRMTDLG